MNEPIRAHIDGGARGNPGPAGFGAHVTDADGHVVAELYGYLGMATNNVAEYAACVAVLQWAVDQGVGRFQIYSDSQLLVRQIEGTYKVRNAGLKPLHARCLMLMKKIPHTAIAHVRREQNVEADALANRAMDEAGGNTLSPV